MTISRNLITNILVFGVSTLISIFLTPFLVNRTSIEVFGAYRTALLFPTYFAILNLLVSGAVSRFLTIALNKNDLKESSEIFSTSFFSMLIVLLLLIPISVITIDNIDIFFHYPNEILNSIKILFLSVIFTGFLQFFSNVFTIPAFAKNRIDVQNYKRLVEMIIQTTLILFLILNFDSPLKSISFAFLASAFTGLIISIHIWKKFSYNLTLRFENFNFDKLKEQINLGKWLVIDHIGVLLLLYIDLILVNYLFGTKATGEYAVAQQWQILLRTIAPVLASVVAPLILIYYSKNEFDKLRKLSLSGFKYLGISFVIIGGILAGYSKSLLRIWIGEEYIHLNTLMIILIIPTSIALPSTILYPIQTAYNKLKIPAFVTITSGLVNLILAYLLAKHTLLGVYGISIAGASVFLLRNIFFTIPYSIYLMCANKYEYFTQLIKNILLMFSIVCFCFLVESCFIISNWLEYIFITIVTGIFLLIIVYITMINKEEKGVIKIKIRRYFEKN